jgi:hypothetical protein
MTRGLLVGITATTLLLGACGGGAPVQQAAVPQGPETRWLRGLAADDVAKAATSRGLVCSGPVREGGTNVWSCAAETPLVTYRVKYYGSAPLKIEYVTATVKHAGPPKADNLRPLFTSLAGLHFEGCDPASARAWVAQAIADGVGETQYGAAKFRVRGTPENLTLDIKASGSEW